MDEFSNNVFPIYFLLVLAGLIYGSNRGSRNLSALNPPASPFTFAALEKAVANQEMAGENGIHDGTDSVFHVQTETRETKDESNTLDENSEWAQVIVLNIWTNFSLYTLFIKCSDVET